MSSPERNDRGGASPVGSGSRGMAVPPSGTGPVVVAGATGTLGRRVVRELRERDVPVRALVREAGAVPGSGSIEDLRAVDLRRPDSLRGTCEGAVAVISCAGASMRLGGWRDRTSFYEVDREGNRNLLAEAVSAGVRRFGYVSVHGGRELRHTAYADAHECMVDALRDADIESIVVRPTGFFAFFAEVYRFARRGVGVVIGDGTARTNPVAAADVAEACVEALLARSAEPEISVGGPETFTRREIVEAALDAAGRSDRIVHLPPALFRGAAAAIRTVNPRIAGLLEFGVEVSLRDVVAPAVGRAGLKAFFAGLADSGAGRS